MPVTIPERGSFVLIAINQLDDVKTTQSIAEMLGHFVLSALKSTQQMSSLRVEQWGLLKGVRS